MKRLVRNKKKAGGEVTKPPRGYDSAGHGGVDTVYTADGERYRDYNARYENIDEDPVYMKYPNGREEPTGNNLKGGYLDNDGYFVPREPEYDNFGFNKYDSSDWRSKRYDTSTPKNIPETDKIRGYDGTKLSPRENYMLLQQPNQAYSTVDEQGRPQSSTYPQPDYNPEPTAFEKLTDSPANYNVDGTPRFKAGGQKKAFIGAAIGLASTVASGLISNRKAKKAQRAQEEADAETQALANQQAGMQGAQALTNSIGDQEYVEDYKNKQTLKYGGSDSYQDKYMVTKTDMPEMQRRIPSVLRRSTNASSAQLGTSTKMNSTLSEAGAAGINAAGNIASDLLTPNSQPRRNIITSTTGGSEAKQGLEENSYTVPDALKAGGKRKFKKKK